MTDPVVTAVAYDPTGSVASYSTAPITSPPFQPVTTEVSRAAGLIRPTRIQAKIGANPLAFDTGTYSYDGAGNILGMAGMGGASFTYDNRSRLIDATVDATLRAHAYDRWGNLTQQGDTTYSINSANQIWKSTINLIDNLNYAHDLRGNLLRDGTTGANQSHFYDALNRLR